MWALTRSVYWQAMTWLMVGLPVPVAPIRILRLLYPRCYPPTVQCTVDPQTVGISIQMLSVTRLIILSSNFDYTSIFSPMSDISLTYEKNLTKKTRLKFRSSYSSSFPASHDTLVALSNSFLSLRDRQSLGDTRRIESGDGGPSAPNASVSSQVHLMEKLKE